MPVPAKMMIPGKINKMSWTEKRISLPFIAPNRPHSLTPSQYAERDVESHKVQAAYLRKLKTMKKKWFVLYGSSPERRAHLEYHDSERKWKSGLAPSREVLLDACLNICRKQDSRDAKNKHVIAVYTLDDCLSILFEEEAELRKWLDMLLAHQKGLAADGRIPKPNYEHMWQVNVKSFKPQNAQNEFSMSGPHRLCVTPTDLKFFPVGSDSPVSFPIVTLRACVFYDRLFQLETGRGCPSGAGTLSLHCEDKEISANLNTATLKAINAMEEINKKPFSKSSSGYKAKSLRKEHSHDHGSCSTTTTTAAGAIGSSMSIASSMSYRPRSESCSKIDKVTLASGSAPKSLGTTSGAPPTSHAHHQPFSFMGGGGGPSRYRTTSEGNHEIQRRGRGGGGSTGSGKHSSFSGSPMSPSPGSYVSSESAGSSNSIDETDFVPERRHNSSINEPSATATSTIFEESSAESFIDPNSNAYKDLSESPPPGAADPLPQTSAPATAPARTATISHLRSSSDVVQYAPIDVVSASPAADAAPALSSTPPTHYTSVLPNQAAAAADLAMTPTSVGTVSSSNSLKRTASFSENTELQRLLLIGFDMEELAISSPSSQSSLRQQQQQQQRTPGDCDVSSPVTAAAPTPVATTSATTASGGRTMTSRIKGLKPRPKQSTPLSVGQTRPQSAKSAVTAAQDEYVMMSPVTTATAAQDEYVMMSPVESAPTLLPTPTVATDADDYFEMSPSAAAESTTSQDEYVVMSPVSATATATVTFTSAAAKDEYVVMSPVTAAADEYVVMSPVNADEGPNNSGLRRNMDIPLRPATTAGGEDTSGSYVLMSPLAAEPDLDLPLPQPTPLSAIEERLSMRAPSTPVHLRQQYDTGGARPKQSTASNTTRSSSKRSSFCGSDLGDGRWSPDISHQPQPVLDLDGQDPDNPDYVPIDYSSRSKQVLQQQQQQQGGPAVVTPIAIPSTLSGGSRMSPASSSSLVSGTPNSTESRFPPEFHLQETISLSHKAMSYLRQNDEDDGPGAAGAGSSTLPLRAYTVSSGGAARYTGRKSTSSVPSRFIDIPGGSSGAAGRRSSSSTSSSKLSPSQFGKTPPAPAGASPLSNPIKRFDSWFRARAGSVPTKPPFLNRRRHRTQSEGEKENTEDGGGDGDRENPASPPN